MPWPSLTHFAFALMFIQGAAPTSTHTWIADLKAKRASLLGKDVHVEGLVVDIRSNSSEAKRGLYRLIDESDPEGVLVRTNRLPADGGAYRVRGMVAVNQPTDGQMMLEEISRDRTDRRSIVAGAFTALSGLALVLLVLLSVRAYRAERAYLVSPPLWLLPDSGPYGKAAPSGGPAAALNLDPDLEEADRKERETLRRRRRSMVRSLGVSLLCLLGSGAWLLASRPGSVPVPAFILIDANDQVAPVLPAPPPDTVFADRPLEPRVDSLFAPRPARRDSAKTRLGPPGAIVGPVRRVDTPSVAPGPLLRPETPATAPEPAPSPPPSPPPAPPPAPPASLPDSRPPARDPEAEKAQATAEAQAGINRLVAAINGKRITELLLLLPESMAGDAGRLERFVNLVKGFAPRATLGTVEPLSLADERGEARFTVSFTWRGDFGVERRKAGRFTGVVRRQEGGWRFEGARLLDALP